MSVRLPWPGFLAAYDFLNKLYERYDQDVESSAAAVSLCTWSPL